MPGATIGPDLARFVEGGVAGLAASVDAANVPDASRVWGATVVDDGRALRVLVPTTAQRAWANLASTGRVAICFTDVATYRSVQVKGTVSAMPDEADPDDLARWERYQSEFYAAVEAMGPSPLVRRLGPAGVRPIVVRVDALFDQTPGGGAGRPLEA